MQLRAGGLTLGVFGNANRFQTQTGQRSTMGHLIVGWGQSSPCRHRLGKTIYIRPPPETNGHWNDYSAYNSNGSARGADHSTASFRKALSRIYLIVHGGDVNARLARLGLPPVRAALTSNVNARVVWNPQGYGSPDVPGNSAQAYYPGDAYVDVVGDDLYDIRGKAEWPSADALYQAYPGEPFAFPEWALWGIDDPAFVDAMAQFVHEHRRTAVLAYYSGQPWLGVRPRLKAPLAGRVPQVDRAARHGALNNWIRHLRRCHR